MLERLTSRCSICFSSAIRRDRGFRVYLCSCPRCGDYEITHEANYDLLFALGGEGSTASLLASYWVSWHLNERVTTKHIPMLQSLDKPSLVERAVALLALVHWVSDGQMAKEIKLMVPRFCGATCCADEAELGELTKFAVEKGWVQEGDEYMSLKLTARGLSRFEGSDIGGQKTDQSTNITIMNSTFVNSPFAAGQGVEQTAGDLAISAKDREILQQLVAAIRQVDVPDHEKEDAILAVERIGQAKDATQVRHWYDHLKGIGSVAKAVPAPVWEAVVTVVKLLGG